MWKTWLILIILKSLLQPLAANINNSNKVLKNSLTLQNILNYNNILFPLTTVSNANLVHEKCATQMQQLRRGILNGELWALKGLWKIKNIFLHEKLFKYKFFAVLDSSGSKPPAFMVGDNLWLGSSALCEAAHTGLHLPVSRFVEHKMNLSLLTEKPPYAVRYRVAYLEHNSVHQVDVVFAQVQPVIHLGLCAPIECSSEDLVRLLSVYLKSELFHSNDLHGLKPRVLRVKELGFKAFAFYDLLHFKLLAIFVVYTLLMSSCAYCLRYRQQSTNSGGTSVASRNQRNQQTNEAPTKLVEFILCYDLQLNCSTIFAWSDTSSKTFAFLNGGRVVSALIATFFHTFILLNAIVSNPVQVFMYASNIGNMDVAMDVFFLIRFVFKPTVTISFPAYNPFLLPADFYKSLLFYKIAIEWTTYENQASFKVFWKSREHSFIVISGNILFT